jgi:hypothetical protein
MDHLSDFFNQSTTLPMEDGGTTQTSSVRQARAWRLKSPVHGKNGGMNKSWDFRYTLHPRNRSTNFQKLRLVRMSMEQKDALTVLLTGRSEAGFADVIKRMVASQKLEFDLIGLKPEVGPHGQRFSSTIEFKRTFLEDLVLTYEQAEEIRVYEDRIKQ